MADDYWRIAESSGMFSVSEMPVTYMAVLAMRGDADAAVEFALENVVDLPITEAIWWREIFDEAFMAEVSTDPRVQAKLQQWDEDLVTTRAALQEFLADNH
jgi:hypothetical protein